jgi:hypothetical protein
MPIRTCLKCGLVKNIKAKGLCSNCYQTYHYGSGKRTRCLKCGKVKPMYAKGLCHNCYSSECYRKNHPLQPITCGCGCGITFMPNCAYQKYLNRKHEEKVKQKRYYNKYMGTLQCPKCGKFGGVSVRYYKNVKGKTIMRRYLVIAHYNRSHSRKIKGKYSWCSFPLI